MLSRCKIHPKYKAVMPPTSGHRDCVCTELWMEEQRKKRIVPGVIVTVGTVKISAKVLEANHKKNLATVLLAPLGSLLIVTLDEIQEETRIWLVANFNHIFPNVYTAESHYIRANS